MSRRRGEFEHRTSIFEGAYCAWSYLGSLNPHFVSNNDPSALELQIEVVCYEPLPRAGLSHPFVTAILTPWLGEGAGSEAIGLGLTTLRTWWQHRRKGESATAIQALSTPRMSSVVSAYTKHFFSYAYCLVVNDGEEAPRTLRDKFRTLERARSKNLQGVFSSGPSQSLGSLGGGGGPFGQPQKRPQAAKPSGNNSAKLQQIDNSTSIADAAIPRIPDISGVVGAMGPPHMKHDQYGGSFSDPFSFRSQVANTRPGLSRVARHEEEMQLRQRQGVMPVARLEEEQRQGVMPVARLEEEMQLRQRQGAMPAYVPVVMMNSAGEYHIVLSVAGMISGHCVKIVETVLRGTGTTSPIAGLLDVCASKTGDNGVGAVLIQVTKSADTKLIAELACRNLYMVGYGGELIQMVLPPNWQKRDTSVDSLVAASDAVALAEKKGVCESGRDLQMLTNAFGIDGPKIEFDWNLICKCPDCVPQEENISTCPRRSQLSPRIFRAFRKCQEVSQHLKDNAIVSQHMKDNAIVSVNEHMYDKCAIPIKENHDDMDGRRSSWNSIMTLMGGREKRCSVMGIPSNEGPNNKRHRESMRMSIGKSFSRAFSHLSQINFDFSQLDDFDLNVDHSEGINDDIIAKQKKDGSKKSDC
mmetsp:Transcript_12347/g.27036  ORF Transcript_12347/g.27036 Transcript_12347/m.27036 type:complete len:639 (-) Transcript_12347:173-2089(-)|eukprot:CAMPEP_0113313640 /NCGR_PEP_ID=MMETSP0010_2-20120614/9983_1 /TAXON_ID=216773 ORGANISM="Corethron hystrix, Strain 308" /NCGR_SAMPLE_ID=MMETSP0010_2 /ASSEMBLY_ACC=CAM_ASM_000155 /LENGTH=638 /DNA_ID=CAMNT_0000169693 /DNA_START=59 /DNA_END=1975 /DNA_ORIENTATION=- /assembly_acc=CAM_ASM_000155